MSRVPSNNWAAPAGNKKRPVSIPSLFLPYHGPNDSRWLLHCNDVITMIRWLAHHQSVVWLSLKAVRQTAQFREETVYSTFMASNKVTKETQQKSFSMSDISRRFESAETAASAPSLDGEANDVRSGKFKKMKSFAQIAALVEDLITVEVWREEILPHLLRDESATLSPLIVYAVVGFYSIYNPLFCIQKYTMTTRTLSVIL